MARSTSTTSLLIPDAGPLFSLAACDCLRLLLHFRCAITDVVWRETAGRGGSAPGLASVEAQAIAAFLLAHPEIEVRETQLGQLIAKAAATKESGKFRNLGELSIHSLLIELRSAVPAVNAVVLFEDHWFSHRLAHFPNSVTFIGTAAFLLAAQTLGHLPSAEAAMADIRRSRPTLSAAPPATRRRPRI